MRSLLAALAVATTALLEAQQPAPADLVLTHFREYRAALERNDFPAAEAAAAEALAASETARGPRTAVLALNLATLRLELGEDYDALTPARMAHQLATESADSGVDPQLASLTLGRAELAADVRGGSRRLEDAIAAAEAEPALGSDVYAAAVALGQWGLDAQEYLVAERAWNTAERVSEATADPTFARARASIGRGTAIFLRNAYPRQTQTGTRTTRVSTPHAQAASDAFVIAQALLRPAAYAEQPPGAVLTAGQLAYAQAVAWQGALLARLESLDEERPTPTLLMNVPGIPPFDGRGLCGLRAFNTGPEIQYPTEALFRYGVGAVVVHFALDATGNIRARTIAASIPPGPLAEAVEKTLPQWRLEKAPDSSPDCRMPPSWYFPVHFILK